MLADLPGCIAWRDPAQAEAQKERLRRKREKEQAEQEIPVLEQDISAAHDRGQETAEGIQVFAMSM